MAITKIYAVKENLKKKLGNIINPEKTDGGLLISSFGVSPETAYLEYQMTRETAETVRGERNKKYNNLAYHLIQSFSPNEVTPEQAHEIGKELAKRFLNDGYEYVLATHIHTEHVHNHIVFNAFSHDTYKKFASNRESYWRLRKTSDDICDEYGLSVIEAQRAL